MRIWKRRVFEFVMVKPARIGLAGLLLLALGCSSPPNPSQTVTSPAPISSPSPSPSPVRAAAPAPAAKPDRYWDGLDKGVGAAAFAQSAQSASDWGLVSSQFQVAASLLKTVPPDSPHYKDAQLRIGRYEQNGRDAHKMASGELKTPPAALFDNSAPARPPAPAPTPAATVVPPPSPAAASAAAPLPSPSPAQTSSPDRSAEYEARKIEARRRLEEARARRAARSRAKRR
ncbi:hypothetical protein [Kamptonema formosum]|uniref:hypothetical protein n=1 Tax=Kamptonema formosum TaxID=331992 RepID=UPI0012DE41D2|nr:hypothetical protein [Oscillatoria sp. PCC 10802]